MDRPRLIIVDGYSLLYRAFYSNRMLSTADGRPTNALYGFTGMLFSLIDQLKPRCILVALDSPGKTFRHAEYAEYKGTRREMPDEMSVQMPMVRDLIAALGFHQLELTGYEADDIIGTVSKKAEANGYHTTIVTGDLDSLQLVDAHIRVVTPKVGVSDVNIYDEAGVIERFGFEPEYLPDYKALAGDSSDNIKGVPGVGDKTASMLVQRFSTIENLIDNLDSVEEKFRKKLAPCVEEMPKMKWLATILRDVPIEFDFSPYELDQAGYARAQAMLESLEFKAHLKRIPKILGPYVDGMAEEAKVEVTSERLVFEEKGEATSVDALRRFVGDGKFSLIEDIAPAVNMFEEGKRVAWIGVGSQVMSAPMDWAEGLFAEYPERVIAADAKPIFRRTVQPGGETPQPVAFDAAVAGYVLQPGRNSYAVADLVQAYVDVAAPHSPAEMAAGLSRLEEPMRARLELEGQTAIYDDIERPLTPILAEMEVYGVSVSRTFLEDFSRSLEGTIASTAKTIHELAGQEFVIGSPKQLGEILFDKLGLPSGKKTKTGYSTGAEILQDLAVQHPIVQEVLTWRELTKLKSTYSDALPRMIEADGRIRSHFNQTVAATGRLSSNEPNLQNIPIRTELGRSIRKAFVAAPGFELASFDYSQIELRLLAHMSQDSMLVDAFQRRVDVHTVTAALMFHLEQDQVTKDQRRLAKLLNYAVLYGVSDYGLAGQLGAGFSINEAKELIKQYNERFPTVKRFTESVVEEARAKGYTTTLRGRRRYFPDIHAQNRNERMYAERAATNAPIQGAAADMIKVAMIDVRKKLGGWATRMLLQVHDELVFELDPSERELLDPIRRLMEESMPLDVPIEVDGKIGANWNEMTPLA
jgi:DNA polymerase-1